MVRQNSPVLFASSTDYYKYDTVIICKLTTEPHVFDKEFYPFMVTDKNKYRERVTKQPLECLRAKAVQ